MADQPQAQQGSTPGHRDMMFCHECQDEWYRDEHGLTCPECGSDFTEIIEDDNDPRDHHMLDPGHSDDDIDTLSDLEDIHAHRDPHEPNPWQAPDDPEEGDISNLQWRQVGPGRFAVTGTIHRTVSPADFHRNGPGIGAGPMTGFASMLNSIIGANRVQQQGQDQGQGRQDEEARNSPNSGSGTTPGGHRFTYTAGARLYPRDADHPGPRLEPVDDLNNVLGRLMAALGEPPGQHTHNHDHHTHARGEFEPADAGGGPALNPLMAFFSQMMTGNGQIGDAVYTQEALDRIISQLMEQNPSSNAPGPASQNDIDSLPRRIITEDMLGSEGKAECSICMDEVKVGEEVTELPCHHWFHHPCVAAWLGEHDTCPHCRKGITKQPTTGDQNNSSGAGASGSSGAGSTPRMPGSFDVTGDGTPQRPYYVPGDSGQPQNQNQNQNQASGAQDGGSAGGLGDMLRRGLFGPQR